LVTSIKTNVSVDWMHRAAARARMRFLRSGFLTGAWRLAKNARADQTT
jgi:hypothetical protein